MKTLMTKSIAFLLAAVLGVGAGLFAAAGYEVTQVTDETMAPSYRAGDHVLIDCIGRDSMALERGDVVVFDNTMYTETGEGGRMIKRIIGMPGEWVSIADGIIYIDGEALDESAYLSGNEAASDDDMIKQFVDSGQYFVLGDHRSLSTDSRSEIVGLVRAEDIEGKVIRKW